MFQSQTISKAFPVSRILLTVLLLTLDWDWSWVPRNRMLQFDKFSWIELCFAKKENLLMQIIVYVVFAIRRTLWYWIGERQSPYYHTPWAYRIFYKSYSVNGKTNFLVRHYQSCDKRLMKVQKKRSLVIGKTLWNTMKVRKQLSNL